MIKNIIIINDFAYINGGAGKVAIESAIGLSHMGYNVTLFSAVAPTEKKLLDSNVKVICLDQKDILSEQNRFKAIKQGIYNSKAYKEFEKLLLTFDPANTIIHYHAWIKALSASLFAVTSKYKFKIIITLHDYFTFCPNGGLFNYKTLDICNIAPSSIKCLMTNCDSRNYAQKIWRFSRQIVQWNKLKKNKYIGIIYISELNKNVSFPILKDISNNWYFVQNPVDIINRDYPNIEKNNKYLFVGRLSSEKGIEMFCRAITDLKLNGCVLGDGYLRKQLQDKYPNIEFKGWVEGLEKDNLIKTGTALVFPSLWYEGAPLTIIEMKSYGIPCIVPDKCSAYEEIINGETGYIFKSGNLNSLKEAILKYEHSDKINMQNRILRDFNPAKYSIETHCKKLIEIYSDFMFVKS